MGEKIVVGPVNKGFRNDRKPFVIDNDSFPTMINAYQWRGRIKRKRGTSFLARLARFVDSTVAPYFISNTTITLRNDGAGNGLGNIFSFFALKGDITNVTQANPGQVTSPNHNLANGDLIIISDVVGMTQLNGNSYGITVVDPNNFTIGIDTTGFSAYVSGGLWQNLDDVSATISPGTVTITDTTSGDVYTDDSKGNLVGVPAGTGTINYVTGEIEITGGSGHVIEAKFQYFPGLPVMGLEDFVSILTQYPGTIGFDTTYSYAFLTSFPYSAYDVSFYKNPTTGTYPGYIEKTNPTPTTWNGQNYQQFWTVNYQGAMWATNGITLPFSAVNIGMQFKPITAMTIDSAMAPSGPSVVTLTIVGHGLVVGDFIFVNEVVYTAPNVTNSINYQTGYVIAVPNANQVTVEFPDAYLTGTYSSGGIAQYLTNRSDVTKDCLRWYDGDPTNGSIVNPMLTGHLGWVNFAPPLSNGIFSVADLPEAQYYLVGARMIWPFKDRLVFFGPVVQTSSANSQVYLKETIIYSQNGTAYYTSSFTGDPSLSTTDFFPILVPQNQSANAPAYWENQTGFGGFLTAGNDQAIISLGINEDVIITEFSRSMARLVYSGNDVVPFNFFNINSEWGTVGTFASITMDQGVLSLGSRGFVLTGQTSSERVDLEIPDQVFEVGLLNNGAERVCSARDFINEWIYFTYVPDIKDNNIVTTDIFPTQTLQYNYREGTWAIFNESYTTYGTFRRLGGYTWATVGFEFPTWSEWNEPWNAGVASQLQPEVIAGTSQGFVLFRDQGTGEATSRFIQDITGTGTITSPGHSLDAGDYIIISGALGTVGSQVNEKIFTVQFVSNDSFALNPPLSSGFTYVGGGLITKMYVPFVQTKQFPTAWGAARKTRLGPQQYLLTTTNSSQITLLIYLSQDATNAYNYLGFPIAPNNIVPQVSPNDSLIYSAILYTCPESTNLGLTPANTNLQMVTAPSQGQTWHRMNTSLIGDTVQIGFSLSDSQMRSLDNVGSPLTITGATQANPCVLTITGGAVNTNQLVFINNVGGMTQLNNRYFNVLASTTTSLTIEVDSTGFDAYVSGGTAQVVSPQNQFAEIELHGFILDVQPSQLLA